MDEAVMGGMAAMNFDFGGTIYFAIRPSDLEAHNQEILLFPNSCKDL